MTKPKRLCGVRCIDGGWYCTRPDGHDGKHIASVGAYQVGAPPLAQWSNDQILRVWTARWESA